MYKHEKSKVHGNGVVSVMEEFPYDIEVVATNLNIPWAIAMSEEGTLYVTERPGTIRVIEGGRLLPEPLIVFEPPFVSRGEGGLLGIALDPDFKQNRYIYVMHTYQEDKNLFNRVVRLIEKNGKASIDRVILDKIPGGGVHDGGRIKIGPDRKLYIATGDAGASNLSQSNESPAGKILRIELDGTIPNDNPYHQSPIYSLGLRNPQGLAWRNDTLYATDHGQQAHDEINRITAGVNYGWPLVQGDESTEDAVVEKPIIQSGNQTWAPSGLTYIDQGPWEGNLLAAGLASKQLIGIPLSENRNEVGDVTFWLVNQYGRLREVIQAKDGSIYITTNNRDGRGFPDSKDDKIIRLLPKSNIRQTKNFSLDSYLEHISDLSNPDKW